MTAGILPSQTPPALPATAATPEEFVPAGWALEQKKTADLNADGRADALLLMRGPQSSPASSRILAVVLRQRSGKGYALSESNSQLIPVSGSPNQEDPMADGELTARRGAFDVKLTLLSGAGSYGTATVQFRFRNQQGCFRLIGYDRMETNRGTLETRDLSVNLLTGTVLRRTGNAQSDAVKEDREKLKTSPRPCFRDVGNAATYNPLPAATATPPQ